MATTNVHIGTLDRVVEYSPTTTSLDGKVLIIAGVTDLLDGKVEVKVPSFLGRIGAELTGTVTAVLSTAAYDVLAKAELGVSLDMTAVEISYLERFTEVRLPPIGDSTPTEWIKVGLPTDLFHYQVVNDGVLTPVTGTHLLSTVGGWIDRLVFPVPSRPVKVLERVVSRIYAVITAIGGPIYGRQRLYVNGNFVQELQGSAWPGGSAAIVEYRFDTPVSGPITSIELDVQGGVFGPYQRLFEWEVDYIYT